MSSILHFSPFCAIVGEERGGGRDSTCVSECIDCSKQVATSVSDFGPSVVQASEKQACDMHDIEVLNDVITTLTGWSEMSKCV